jgi:hypothetical protein
MFAINSIERLLIAKSARKKKTPVAVAVAVNGMRKEKTPQGRGKNYYSAGFAK